MLLCCVSYGVHACQQAACTVCLSGCLTLHRVTVCSVSHLARITVCKASDIRLQSCQSSYIASADYAEQYSWSKVHKTVHFVRQFIVASFPNTT